WIGRNNIRAKYNIEGTPTSDCCSVFWCATCAMVQEKRELDHVQRLVPLPSAQPGAPTVVVVVGGGGGAPAPSELPPKYDHN
ncbi:hypothetical protein HK405_000132, partial [Cladochytrium tenue]